MRYFSDISYFMCIIVAPNPCLCCCIIKILVLTYWSFIISPVVNGAKTINKQESFLFSGQNMLRCDNDKYFNKNTCLHTNLIGYLNSDKTKCLLCWTNKIWWFVWLWHRTSHQPLKKMKSIGWPGNNMSNNVVRKVKLLYCSNICEYYWGSLG